MDSKIDLSRCAANEKNPKPCHYHQQMGNKSLFAAIACGCLIILLLCWNIHLSSELSQVQNNINYLLSHCHQESRDHVYYDSDVTKPDGNEENSEMKHNEAHNFFHQNAPRSPPVTENEELPSNQKDHVIVKRSRAAAKAEKKEIRQIMKMIRKRKGLAIHVKARRPNSGSMASSNNQGPGQTVPGQTITDWEVEDPELSSKSKFGLAALTTDGCISAPIDGYYYVYSQVVFTKTPRQFMSAYVGVGSFGLTTFTKCLLSKTGSGSNVFYNTCQANGIKYLKRRECIAITVQPSGVEVYMDPTYTYFGAYFVGLAAD